MFLAEKIVNGKMKNPFLEVLNTNTVIIKVTLSKAIKCQIREALLFPFNTKRFGAFDVIFEMQKPCLRSENP